MLIEKKS